MHDQLPSIDPDASRRAYARAGAARWGLTLDQWDAALARGLAARFAGRAPTPDEQRHHLDGLHLDDLALATACAAGLPEAWDHFVLTFRPVLYRAADAVRGVGDAREVADELYGDLFGTQERDGERRSLLRYYHGRSSLAGWLRSVFSQRLVDRIRAGRRFVAFEEAGGADRAAGLAPPGPAVAPPPLEAEVGDPYRDARLAALRQALAAAIAALDAGLRLRLALYYGRGLTLAAIGRLVGESEATVSRRLDKARQEIRTEVARRLRDEHGLTAAQVDQAFAEAPADGRFDVRDVLPVPDS